MTKMDCNGMSIDDSHDFFEEKKLLQVEVNSNQSFSISTLNELLVKAVESKAAKMIKYFVDLGANINSHDKLDKPILIVAIENDDYDSVREILFFGANPNAYYLGDPALFLATQGKKLNITAQLLKYGAKVDCISEQGYTPLFYATYLGMDDFVELLVRYNANKDITINGISALERALQTKQQNIIKILNNGYKHISYSANALVDAIKNNKLLLVKSFIENNRNEVQQVIKNYPILLHIAINNEADEIVDLLIDNNVDINAINEGLSALYVSSYLGFNKITESLLKAGANPELMPSNNCSALCRAILEDNVEDVKLLLHHGAKVIYDNNLSPLFLSQIHGNKKIAKLVLDHYRENIEEIRKENSEYTTKYDRSGKTFEVVMVRYKEDVVHEEFPSCNVTFYNKGEDLSLPNNFKVIKYPNVGYLGGPFLEYIIKNYYRLPDRILLVQGNPHDSPYIRFPIEEQYKGKLQSSCDHIIGVCVDTTLSREWNVLERLDWDNIKLNKFNLGDFNLLDFVHDFICPDILPDMKIKVNYGSQFAADKEFFLSQPIEYWQRLHSLYNEAFPIADHGFERTLDIMGGGCPSKWPFDKEMT